MVHGLSCPEACGILVSRPRIKPTSPTLEGGSLTTGWQGTPLVWFLAQCPLLRVAFLDHPTSDGPSCRHHYQSCYPRQPWNCGFTTLFIICLLHYNGSSIRTGNLAALRHPQHVEQRLAHSRRSINICGMNSQKGTAESVC